MHLHPIKSCFYITCAVNSICVDKLLYVLQVFCCSTTIFINSSTRIKWCRSIVFSRVRMIPSKIPNTKYPTLLDPANTNTHWYWSRSAVSHHILPVIDMGCEVHCAKWNVMQSHIHTWSACFLSRKSSSKKQLPYKSSCSTNTSQNFRLVPVNFGFQQGWIFSKNPSATVPMKSKCFHKIIASVFQNRCW